MRDLAINQSNSRAATATELQRKQLHLKATELDPRGDAPGSPRSSPGGLRPGEVVSARGPNAGQPHLIHKAHPDVEAAQAQPALPPAQHCPEACSASPLYAVVQYMA